MAAPTKETGVYETYSVDDEIRTVINKSQVQKAVRALYAYHKNYVLNSKKGKDLFSDTPERICLQITLRKVPPGNGKRIVLEIPNRLHTDVSDVCLIVKDIPNMDETEAQEHYEELLKKAKVTGISQIYTLRTIKREFKEYEAKRKLCNSYDVFLGDDRIYEMLPRFLGKVFYVNKKFPLPVTLKKKYLMKTFTKVMSSVPVTISSKGACVLCTVAHTGLTVDQTVDNILTSVVQFSKKHYKDKMKNIKQIHLKTPTSVSLPIYSTELKLADRAEEVKQKAQREERRQELMEKYAPKKKGVHVKKEGHVKRRALISGKSVPVKFRKLMPGAVGNKVTKNVTQDKETKSLEKENKSLEKETKSLEKKSKSLEKETKSLEKENKSLEKQTKSLDKQTKSLEKQTKSLDKQTKSLEKRTKSLDKETKSLDEEAVVNTSPKEDVEQQMNTDEENPMKSLIKKMIREQRIKTSRKTYTPVVVKRRRSVRLNKPTTPQSC